MPNRKGQYSCDFCRSRKLRCDRPLPCGNCVSRGKTCGFQPVSGQRQRQKQRPQAAQVADATVTTSTSPAPAPAPVTHTPQYTPQPARVEDQQAQGLLADLRSLQKLAEDLERRVIQSTDSNQCDNDHGTPVQLTSGPPPISLDIATTDENQSPSSVEQVGEFVAHLERVSMIPGRQHIGQSDELVLKVSKIRAIPRKSRYVVRCQELVPCVWLPQHHEAKKIVSTYMSNLSYIHHIVHHPSMPAFVDEVYHEIDQQGSVKPGPLFLLLSMIATTTYTWTAHDGVGFEDSLFASETEASAQTDIWIRAAYDVFNAGQNGPPAALETVQGACILGLLICNLEGVSLRYRHLVSTGLWLCRQLGLHRLDRGPDSEDANTIRAEVGRRVWWFLVATDWLTAARYGDGTYHSIPCQMSVKRPRNINDVDLTDHGVNVDLPISHPTDMSYFLQRISVAEIARRMVDHHQDNSGEESNPCSSRTYAQVMTIDAELEQLIHELPPFLHFDNLKETQDTAGAGIFIQAYFLNSNLNIQRCKLHLGYLASKPSESLAYVYSRDACLRAARRLVRGEMQLERSQHVFARMRLRLTGILFGVFMAGIVLLMDACVNGSGAVQDEIRNGEGGEAAEALRIIEDARSQSVAAANLYQSLMQMLAMFRAQKEKQQPQKQQQDAELHASDMNASVYQLDPGSQTPMSHPAAPIGARIAWNGDPGPSHMQESSADSQYSLNHSQLFRTIEELTNFDGFQWDDLFSEMDASSLF